MNATGSTAQLMLQIADGSVSFPVKETTPKKNFQLFSITRFVERTIQTKIITCLFDAHSSGKDGDLNSKKLKIL